MGSDRLVVGPGKRTGTPTAQDMARFASGVSEVAAAARDKGIVAGMHPHWNTVIEQRDEITRFFDAVDTDLVKLALDPAHIAKAGDDPVEVASAYRDILTYMHIKDYVPELDVETPDVASAQDHAPRIAFFGELGTGVVDLPALLDVAREAGYDGWLTVELDRSQTTPRQSLEASTPATSPNAWASTSAARTPDGRAPAHGPDRLRPHPGTGPRPRPSAHAGRLAGHRRGRPHARAPQPHQ